jgi:tRNA A-37 threonylcarbamoyl transferase component Bud32
MRPSEIIADRFEIRHLASSGGMGAVYRAYDRVLAKDVAVKTLFRQSLDETERFAREAEVLAALEHPGIVGHIAHGRTSEGELYLVMEWLEGEDLAACLERRALSVDESLAIAAQAADALEAAHAQGIVHRDVKPSNLFLVGGGIERIKILDFGIARLGEAARSSTRTGSMIGTPGYMAPEQARGDRQIDASADVFALGCVLFECLTGRAVFVGAHPMAVLAKILFEQPPRLRDLRPDLPRELDALVARMLATDPAGRPARGAAVLAEIEALAGVEADARSRQRVSLAPAALGAGEQRPLCVILVGPPAQAAGAADAPTMVAPPTNIAGALREIVEAVEGRLEPLADGSLVATLWGARTATDQVMKAARCALALRALLPGVPMALATGRGVIAGRWPVGAAIDRAARMLHPQARAAGASAAIRIDEVTAGLLDVRFDVGGSAASLELRGERELVETTRTLLGKPTPCVGRERELGALLGLFEQCVTEPVARAALVVGHAGVGKSRLRHEVLRAVRAQREGVEIWLGRGDAMSAGAPFGMIAPPLRRLAGILDGEPLAVRRKKLGARVARHLRGRDLERVTCFLGELVGVPFPDDGGVELRAARRDPMLMGDQMRRAFEDFLAAEATAQPVLIVLEDLHWGDLPSVTFLDSALRNHPDLPWMVLGLARPEVHALFPELWRERGVDEIRLGGLTRRGSEKLVRAVLGDAVAPDVVEAILDRSAGNVFYLEELIRAVAEGKGDALPETVLTMAQARLDHLDVEARRILRAAAIFGRLFCKRDAFSRNKAGPMESLSF